MDGQFNHQTEEQQDGEEDERQQQNDGNDKQQGNSKEDEDEAPALGGSTSNHPPPDPGPAALTLPGPLAMLPPVHPFSRQAALMERMTGVQMVVPPGRGLARSLLAMASRQSLRACQRVWERSVNPSNSNPIAATAATINHHLEPSPDMTSLGGHYFQTMHDNAPTIKDLGNPGCMSQPSLWRMEDVQQSFFSDLDPHEEYAHWQGQGWDDMSRDENEDDEVELSEEEEGTGHFHRHRHARTSSITMMSHPLCDTTSPSPDSDVDDGGLVTVTNLNSKDY